MVVRIKKSNKPAQIKKALNRLARVKKKKRKIADYYGKLPGAYGDGLIYQQKLRDEWS